MLPRLLPAANDSAAVVALDRDSDAIVVFLRHRVALEFDRRPLHGDWGGVWYTRQTKQERTQMYEQPSTKKHPKQIQKVGFALSPDAT
jgi:hypothetical protein